MSVFRSTAATLALVLGVGAFSTAHAAGLQVESTFESGLLSGWLKVRDNLPVVTTERARAGKYSMKATLSADAPTGREKERNEMQSEASHAEMGKAYWYGFSVYLGSDYAADSVWELVAQWYPWGDNDAEWSMNRQPPLSLQTTNGVWKFESKTDPRAQTTDTAGVSSRSWEVGPQQLGKWTDWVLNVKWSYGSDGYIKAWKDGKVVLDVTGPNTYNDKQGPHVKMGIYKGWAKMPVDRVRTRTVFIDEFRMAGSTGSYAAVAPGGGALKVPMPPAALLIQ